ncbi:HesB/YadR/YfhF family protein [Paenibacillus guangzhouensis]|uniref:HesB/YadR/YfhF family protein n=1 Tax=Paenibacillus guangzhouensis TaxID=1473112 RepID=UPI0012676D9F|nr:Fe-S cluster assembly protein HesB [Paenibacillus guangzhouensis]
MAILISEEAIHTFHTEWGLEEGQYVRIYAKYVGGGGDAFSIGINVSADPIDPVLVEPIGGYHFFVEESDAWILKDTLLKIDRNEDGIVLNVE